MKTTQSTPDLIDELSLPAEKITVSSALTLLYPGSHSPSLIRISVLYETPLFSAISDRCPRFSARARLTRSSMSMMAPSVSFNLSRIRLILQDTND